MMPSRCCLLRGIFLGALGSCAGILVGSHRLNICWRTSESDLVGRVTLGDTGIWLVDMLQAHDGLVAQHLSISQPSKIIEVNCEVICKARSLLYRAWLLL